MTIEEGFSLLKGYSDIIFEVELENSVLLNMSSSLQYLLNYQLIFEKQEFVVNLLLLVQNMIFSIKNEKLLKNIITFLENLILSSSINKENAPVTVTKIFELTNNILIYVLDKVKTHSTSLEFYNSTEFIFWYINIYIVMKLSPSFTTSSIPPSSN